MPTGEVWQFNLDLHRWRHAEPASSTDPRPRHRAYVTSCVYNGLLVVFGGFSGTTVPLSDVWAWDPELAEWSLLDAGSGPARGGSFVECDAATGKMLVWSGSDSWTTSANDLWEFDIPNATWTRLHPGGASPTVPPGRYSGCSALHGGFFYAGFGWEDAAEIDLADWNVFDLDTQLWVSLRDVSMEIPPMDSVACSIGGGIGDALWLFGGWGEVDISNSFATVDLSLPHASQRWNVLSNTTVFPIRRSRHSAAVMGSDMFIYGGESSAGTLLSSLWKFSLLDNSWERLAPQGTIAPALAYHTSVALADRVLAIMGSSSSGVSRDVWSYSVLQDTWQKLTCNADPAAGEPLARVSLCAVAETGTTALVFGGQSVDRAHNDIWRLTLLTEGTCQWTLLADDASDAAVENGWAPAGRTDPSCAIFHDAYGTKLVIAGGDTYGTALGDLWVYAPLSTSGTWTNNGTLPTGSGRLPVVQGNTMALVGGRRYENFCADPFILARNGYSSLPLDYIITDSEFELVRRVDSSIAVFASELFVFAGSPSVEPNATILPGYRSNELITHRLSPICSDGSARPPTCWGCSLGSQYSSSTGRCVPCSPGTYGVMVGGNAQCRPCPSGFYGPFTGAASSALCMPCEEGTFNPSTGASTCALCSSLSFCPMASTYQHPSSEGTFDASVITTQPVFNRVGEDEVRAHDYQLYALALGASLVGLLMLFILLLVIACGKKFRIKLKNADLLYQESHNTEQGPMFVRRRSIGGATTLTVILVIATLVAVQFMIFFINNTSIIVSLEPRCRTLDTGNQSAWLNVTATIALRGFHGNCSLGNGRCAEGIVVSFDGETLGSEQYSCTQSESMCNVTISEELSTTLVGATTLTIDFDGKGSYASGVLWEVSALAIPTVIDEQPSSINSTLRSSENRLLRGSEPCVIELRAIPTHYQNYIDEYNSWGHHLEYVSQMPGTEARPSDFVFLNGVHVSVLFTQPDTVFNIEVHRKQEAVQFLLTLIGGISGVFGGSAVVMNMLQEIPPMLRKARILKKKPVSASDSPSSSSLGASTHEASSSSVAAAAAAASSSQPVEIQMDDRKPYQFKAFMDRFTTLEQVQEGLRRSGLEGSNLIIGIDFTISNQTAGLRTFGGVSLHSTAGGIVNPYMRAIGAIGRTLEALDDDRLIPVYGFGDERTKDRSIFSFTDPGHPCVGVASVLQKYVEIAPRVSMSGPTSFAPIIMEALNIVRTKKSYHILLIIADGQVTQDSDYCSATTDTVRAIVAASEFPLSIVIVGVGDGPWDKMREFDDKLPQRRFDNLNFVDFAAVYGTGPVTPEADTRFAVAALQEIPDQYAAIRRLGLL